MSREREELTKVIHEIMWYSRGSITREDAWTLSPDERRIEQGLIKERLKASETSGMVMF
jgi:hypothetical protein